jgi:hypothetical protein
MTTKQPKWPVCEKCMIRWTDTCKAIPRSPIPLAKDYKGRCKPCKGERVNERNEVISK